MVDHFIQPDHPASLAKQLVVLSVSHATANTDLRARVALSETDAVALHQRLVAVAGEEAELLVLSTCNRTELYVAGGSDADIDHLVRVARQVWQALRGFSDTDATAIRERRGVDALRHLCRVASGLESVVVGETQIVQQLREALAAALDGGRVGPIVHTVTHLAFRISRRVRTETGIQDGRVSTASVAVEMAQQHLGSLTGRTAVVVGAGRIGRLAVEHLLDRGIGEIRIVNRTRANADQLARLAANDRTVASSWWLDELDIATERADVVISAVGGCDAGNWLLPADRFAPLARDGRRVIVDLGMPATVDPAAGCCAGQTLIGIDQLDRNENSGRWRRLAEVPAAESIVETELAALVDRNGAISEGVMRSLFRQFSDVTRCEVARQSASGLPQTEHDLQKFAERLVRKLFAPLSSHVRSDEVESSTLRTLVTLFDLMPGDRAG